jgi:hypothetical protein
VTRKEKLAKTDTQNFKDLLVWQKGMALAEMIYQTAERFPHEERFGRWH